MTIENANINQSYLKPLVAELDQQLEANRGLSLWKLDLAKISEQALQKPWIESLAISRSWPSRLNLRILPKDVKLLYVSSSGELYPIVEGGIMLPSVTPKTSPDVTLLQGEEFEKNLELRKKAVKAIQEIPVTGKFSQRNISELRYDAKEGFWATLIQSGLRVKMGEDQFSLKSARVSQVIEYMESRQLEARVIDANLSKKVLVRLRKGP